MNKKNPKIMLVMDRIQDPGSEIWDPRSGIRVPRSGILKKLIPDTGVKKAPDPGSTTLKNILLFHP
jgi:hypothetical protein